MIQAPIFTLNLKTNFESHKLIAFFIYFQYLFNKMFIHDSIQNIR